MEWRAPGDTGMREEVVAPAERGAIWVGYAKLVVSGFLHLSRRKQSLEGWDGAFPPISGHEVDPWGWQKLWTVWIMYLAN